MRWDDQELSVTGEWWIDDPTNPVPGRLEEVPGRGLVLTVLGDLSGPLLEKQIPEVHGSGYSGAVLTGASMVASERTGSDLQLQEFLVESALIGTQCPPSSLAVVAGSARFTGLESWRPGISFRWDHEDFNEVTATFRRPPVQSAAVSNGSISLVVGERTHSSSGEVRIQAVPSFVIRLDKPVAYNEFLSQWIGPLRDLNSLVTSHQSALVHLEVLPNHLDGPPIVVRGTPVERDSKVRPPALTALDLDSLQPPEWPGSPPLPASLGFQDLFEAWWSLYDSQRLALDQYFSSYYNPVTPTGVRLLGHLVVLETFHHHKYPYAVTEPKEEFDRRKNRILDPERWKGSVDDLKWLKKRPWKLMNNPTLAERLLALADLTDALDGVVGDWKSCSEQLAHTRNFLAHGNTRLADKAIPECEYEPASRLLDSWIRALFWHEVGFTDLQVELMLRRTQSFADLRESINQPWIRSTDL